MFEIIVASYFACSFCAFLKKLVIVRVIKMLVDALH